MSIEELIGLGSILLILFTVYSAFTVSVFLGVLLLVLLGLITIVVNYLY